MEKLLNILKGLHPHVDWEHEAALVDSGLIDSYDMINLVGEINEAFGVEIGVEDLEPENFNHVTAIVNLIKNLGADI